MKNTGRAVSELRHDRLAEPRHGALFLGAPKREAHLGPFRTVGVTAERRHETQVRLGLGRFGVEPVLRISHAREDRLAQWCRRRCSARELRQELCAREIVTD